MNFHGIHDVPMFFLQDAKREHVDYFLVEIFCVFLK